MCKSAKVKFKTLKLSFLKPKKHIKQKMFIEKHFKIPYLDRDKNFL